MNKDAKARPRVVLVNRAIIVDPVTNKILLIKRSETDTYLPGMWELPGGKLDEGQDISNALEREVLEETNLVVLPTNRIAYYNSSIITTGKYKDMANILLVGITKVIGGNVKISEEHDDFKWVEIKDIDSIKQISPESLKAILVLKDKISLLL